LSLAYMQDASIYFLRGGIYKAPEAGQVGGVIKKAATQAKNPKLAQRTRETLTQAGGGAGGERIDRGAQERRKGRVDRAKLAEVLAYFRSLPKQNEHLTDDEIIGYDENGLPK